MGNRNTCFINNSRGSFNWATSYYHNDNSFTMKDFLENYLQPEANIILEDGNYSEIEIEDKKYALEASGNGDSYNHCIEWKEIGFLDNLDYKLYNREVKLSKVMERVITNKFYKFLIDIEENIEFNKFSSDKLLTCFVKSEIVCSFIETNNGLEIDFYYTFLEDFDKNFLSQYDIEYIETNQPSYLNKRSEFMNQFISNIFSSLDEYVIIGI